MATQSEHSKRIFRNELNGLDAVSLHPCVNLCHLFNTWDLWSMFAWKYSRHKRFVRDYIKFYGTAQPDTARVGKTELDILQENHRYACVA